MIKQKILEETPRLDANLESPKRREQWKSPGQFLLASMAYTIGVGTLWRFPYLAYRNGGGAFLIAYVTILSLVGLPLLFIEAGIGQHFGTGGITAWHHVSPMVRGIGYGSVITAFAVNCYYVVLLAYSLLYLVNSLQSELPWSNCGNWWNSASCATTNSANSASEFWNHRILQKTQNISEPGGIQLELALALLFVWILSFAALRKGVASIGCAVYPIALIPFGLLTALLGRSLFLPGAWTGISYYLAPNMSKLIGLQVWSDATVQVIFTFGLALGVMTSLGSFNRPDVNYGRQLIYLTTIHTLTAFISGIAVFAIFGYLAFTQNVPISEVATSGARMAFITFPQVFAAMPWSSLWAVIFFSLIFLLGFGSQLMCVYGFLVSVMDLFPHYFAEIAGKRRQLFTGLICAVSYLIGLTMVTRGGKYVFDLFDYYAASQLTVLLFCLLESIAIGWIYNGDQFKSNTERMIGIKLSNFWVHCWKYVIPVICSIGLLYTVVTFHNLPYLDCWAIALGWFILLVPIALVPALFVHSLYCSSKKNNYNLANNQV